MFRSDGVFEWRSFTGQADSPASEFRATGTYTVNNGTVTFHGSDGITVTGMLREAGARLEVEFSFATPSTSHRAVFLRQ